jgi:quercetin dioxygenase-like cupin family protein
MTIEQPFPGVQRETRHTEQATLARYEFEPGAEFPLHTHAEEQITVILTGSVEFEVGGELQRLGPGETSVVAARVEHGLRAGPEGASFVAVLVPRRATPDAYQIKGDKS